MKHLVPKRHTNQLPYLASAGQDANSAQLITEITANAARKNDRTFKNDIVEICNFTSQIFLELF